MFSAHKKTEVTIMKEIIITSENFEAEVLHSDKPVTVEIFWDGGSQSKTITVGGN